MPCTPCSYALFTIPERTILDPVSSFANPASTNAYLTSPRVIVAAEFTQPAINTPVKPAHPIFDGVDRIMVRDYQVPIGVTTPMLLRLAPQFLNPADGSIQVGREPMAACAGLCLA